MTSPPRNRGWLWYLAILATLTVASVVGMIVYNQRQQLTRAELEQARALWQEKGPSSYTLAFTKKGTITDRVAVEVRAGKVVKVVVNDRPEERQFSYYGMPGLFDDLEGFLDIKEKPGASRKFLRAVFDATDGHVRQFLFSDPTTRQAEEVQVEQYEPVAPSAPVARPDKP